MAREAPVYGLSGDSTKAEESILFPRLLSNRKSNARKSEFRAFDYRNYGLSFAHLTFCAILA